MSLISALTRVACDLCGNAGWLMSRNYDVITTSNVEGFGVMIWVEYSLAAACFGLLEKIRLILVKICKHFRICWSNLDREIEFVQDGTKRMTILEMTKKEFSKHEPTQNGGLDIETWYKQNPFEYIIIS